MSIVSVYRCITLKQLSTELYFLHCWQDFNLKANRGRGEQIKHDKCWITKEQGGFKQKHNKIFLQNRRN